MSLDFILDLLCRLLDNINIPANIISASSGELNSVALSFRRLFDLNFSLATFTERLSENCRPNYLYRCVNMFHCSYTLFRIPDPETERFFIAGPYLFETVTEKQFLEYVDEVSMPPHLTDAFRVYYQAIPVITHESVFTAIITTFAEIIFGGPDQYTITYTHGFLWNELEMPLEKSPPAEENSLSFDLRVLEERYALEQELLQAVAMGMTKKAEQIFSKIEMKGARCRLTDPVHDAKNYTIILNTLLRKAAEKGSVHPLYIDRISSEFAGKIELITSKKQASSLQNQMIRKYCLLVQNHSLKGYSLLVQKVIVQIDLDISADLGLKTLAKLLNVNASYLSTLFKKETGSTLTSYVNQKRIEHAILLLNSTSMQIQTIAHHCGFSDLNYFTRTFKKAMGKTPKEYKKLLSGT